MSTKQKWKELCAGMTLGVVLSSAGMALINKLSKEDKKENKTEQMIGKWGKSIDPKTEQMIEDMSLQGISVTKKGVKGAPDSVLTSVDVKNPFYQRGVYSNPKYRASDGENVEDIKLGDKKETLFLTTEEAKRVIYMNINYLKESDLPADTIKAEIKKLRKIYKNLQEGSVVYGAVVSDRSTVRLKTTQNFEYDKNTGDDMFAWDPSVTKGKKKSDNPEQETEFKVYHRAEFDFVNTSISEPEMLIKKMKERNVGKEGKLAFENSQFRDRSEEIAKSNEDQVTTKQKRAPKPKAPKRTVSRDALAARVMKTMEARKGRKG